MAEYKETVLKKQARKPCALVVRRHPFGALFNRAAWLWRTRTRSSRHRTSPRRRRRPHAPRVRNGRSAEDILLCAILHALRHEEDDQNKDEWVVSSTVETLLIALCEHYVKRERVL